MLENFDNVKGQNINFWYLIIFSSTVFHMKLWPILSYYLKKFFKNLILPLRYLKISKFCNFEILGFFNNFQWCWLVYGKKTWNRKIRVNILCIRGGKTNVNSQYHFKLSKISLSANQKNFKSLELSMREWTVIDNSEKIRKIPTSQNFKISIFWNIPKAKCDFWKISSNNVIELAILSYQNTVELKIIKYKKIDILTFYIIKIFTFLGLCTESLPT